MRGGTDSSFRLIFYMFMALIPFGSVLKYRETLKLFIALRPRRKQSIICISFGS